MGGVPCNVCGKVMRTRYNLNIHMAVHTGAKPHVCEICHKGFQQKWNLITHISRIHAGSKPFVCQECGRSFGYASHFKAHVKTHFISRLNVSDEIKKQVLHPHPCSFCSRRFDTAKLLMEHKRSHTGERPYICDSCGKAFATKKRIMVHIQRNCKPNDIKGAKQRQTTPTVCEVCGKIVARYTMNKHLNIHTRRRIYTCRTCGREFLEAGQRTVHERTHTGHKPHSCEICGKAHAQLGNLLAHRRIHHGLYEKPPKGIQTPVVVSNLSATEPNKDNLPLVIVPDYSKEDNRIIIETNINIQPLVPTFQSTESSIDTRTKIEEIINSEVIEVKDIQPEIFKVTAVNIMNTDQTELTYDNKTNANCDPKTDISECHGDKTIQEFLKSYDDWIKNRIKDQKIDNNSCISDNELSDIEDNAEVEDSPSDEGQKDDISESETDVTDNGKDIFNKFMTEVGHIPLVKRTLAKVKNKGDKKDYLIRLLRKLGEDIPNNTVIRRLKDDTYSWCCWDCPKTFRSRALLSRHRLIHAPAHKRPHRCQICSRTFTQSGNLQHHMLVHKKEHRFFCEVCGARFRHKSHFTNHRNKHDNINSSTAKFQCGFCEKLCTTRFHLVEHIRTHTKERPYLCRICGAQFATCSSYNRHQRRHKGKEDAGFDKSKEFYDSSSRTSQRKTTEPSVHPCSCGKVFAHRTSLLRHVPQCINNDSPRIKTFRCQQCDKSFADLSGLKRHLKTHDSTRRYTCNICKLNLKTKETLTRHLLRHQRS